MGTPLLGVFPVVTIAGQSFDSPAIWHWLTRTLDSGGSVWITDQKPDGVLPSVSGDGDQPIYPHVWARQMNPRTESVGLETVWIWAHPAGRPWTMFQDPFSNIQGENNIIPLYQSATQKYGGVKISNGVPEPFQPWTDGGEFWRDFAKAAVIVGGLAVGVTALTGAFSGVAGAGVTGVAPGAVAVAPSEWAIATAGMGEGMGTGGLIANVASTVPVVQAVAPSEWAIATAGMGEGMGTGGILAAVPAVTPSLPTLAQIGGAVQSTVQTVQQAASSIVGVAAAVETVKAAVHTPDTPIPQPADPTPNISPMLIGVGILLLVLVTVE